jgi:hypothetical protein
MPRPLAAHGTYSAYKRHLREKSPVCEPCIAARDARTAATRADRKSGRAPAPPAPIRSPPPPADLGLTHRAALEHNLALVTAAMEHVAREEPAKLAPLSKRHSELLVELEHATEAGNEVTDPFDAFLGSNVSAIAGR